MSSLRRDPTVLWRRSGRRVVLLPTGCAEPIVLDGIGRLVWELLDEPTAREDLVDVLGEHFDEPRDQVEVDLEPFLEELTGSGALTVGA